jgi:hypothetical protein
MWTAGSGGDEVFGGLATGVKVPVKRCRGSPSSGDGDIMLALPRDMRQMSTSGKSQKSVVPWPGITNQRLLNVLCERAGREPGECSKWPSDELLPVSA